MNGKIIKRMHNGVRVQLMYQDLMVTAQINFNVWEGDPNVVKGVHKLGTVVDDIQAYAPGSDIDLYHLFSAHHINELHDAILEAANDER